MGNNNSLINFTSCVQTNFFFNKRDAYKKNVVITFTKYGKKTHQKFRKEYYFQTNSKKTFKWKYILGKINIF